MKKTILIGGTKGGSGKSTVARLLAKGIADLGHFAAIIQTDIDGVLPPDNRKYLTLNGAGEEKSIEAITKVESFDEGDQLFITIIDGSASDNLSTDEAYAEISDLVVFPFKSGYEDMVRAKRNLDAMPRAFGLPNAWASPFTPAHAKASAGLVKEFPAFEARLLEPVYQCAASENLARDEIQNVTRVNQVSRALATQILELMGISPFAKEFPIE